MNKNQERDIARWLEGLSDSGGIWTRLAVVCGVMAGLAVIAQAWLIATVVQLVVMEQAGGRDILFWLASLIVIVLVRAGFLGLQELAGFHAGASVRQSVRQRLLTRLELLGPAELGQQAQGQWLTLLYEQVEKLQDFYARYRPRKQLAMVIPIFVLVAALTESWMVAVIFAVTAPLIPLFMILVGWRAAEANRQNFVALSRLGGHFLDRLQGLSTLVLFHRAAGEKDGIQLAAESFRQKTMQVLRMAFLSGTVLEFFTSIAIAVTAVFLGMNYLGYLNFGIWQSSLTLGSGLFLLLLAPEFYQPLRELGAAYHARAEAIGAAERIRYYLDEHPFENTQANNHSKMQNLMPDEAVSVLFRNVSVRSKQTDRLLLDNISFSIAAGERCVLVGASGAGKTTLINCLLGFQAYSGEILINGVELGQLELTNWRSRLGWLGQNPLLVPGSVRDNLLLGLDPDSVSQADIYTALDKSHVRAFVDTMPLGLDGEVGEGAARVSVGQAQRIALARVMIRQPQLVLLDEPTASLDQKNADLVLESLNDWLPNRTSLMVSHRFEGVKESDVIVVLESGQLKGCGRFETLAQSCAGFSALLEAWQLESGVVERDYAEGGHADV